MLQAKAKLNTHYIKLNTANLNFYISEYEANTHKTYTIAMTSGKYKTILK